MRTGFERKPDVQPVNAIGGGTVLDVATEDRGPFTYPEQTVPCSALHGEAGNLRVAHLHLEVICGPHQPYLRRRPGRMLHHVRQGLLQDPIRRRVECRRKVVKIAVGPDCHDGSRSTKIGDEL